MYPSDDLLEAAKSIRPFLSKLLEENAEEMDRHLAELIARCQAGEHQENQIAELLASRDATRKWMAEFLKNDGRQEAIRNYSPLPGAVGSVGAPKYICPEGDYIWYRLDSSDPIPLCPTHQILLVLAESS